jgi:hypothetical protein
MKNSSYEFIVGTLKGKVTNKEVDWYEVLGFLELHRISGLFYSKCRELGVILPSKVDKILYDEYQKQRRKVYLLRSYIKEISTSLIDKDISHIFLKGSIFSNSKNELSIYQDGERSSNDIDILVKSDDITSVSNVLKELGFIRGYYDKENDKIIPFSRLEVINRRMNRGEVASFVKLTNDLEFPYVEVDINFSLGNTPNEYIELLNEMIDERILYNKEFDIYGANPTLFFIHLIIHQYKELTLYFMVKRNKDIDLYKIADIYYLLKINHFSINELKELANKFWINIEIGTVINIVGKLFNDNEIIKLSNEFKVIEPIIIDYENNRRYKFIIDVDKRILIFDNLKYLYDIDLEKYVNYRFKMEYLRGTYDDE